MLKSLKNSAMFSNSLYSIAGQASFLVSNFLLFIVLLKEFPQEAVGVWALFITVISIVDSMRQGLIQNGLTRLLIQKADEEAQQAGSGLTINFSVIILSAILLYFGAGVLANLWEAPALVELFKQSWKPLVSLGTIQMMNILCFAKNKFKLYARLNLIYMVTLLTIMMTVWYTGNLSFNTILNGQLLAVIPPVLYMLFKHPIAIAMPKMAIIKELLGFGKYIAGTNLLSLLFNKADVLMIAYFLDPISLALFHFASRIIQYIELPLTALSQVIYPRLAASYHANGVSQLKKEYGRSILTLLALIIPGVMVIDIFNTHIINILSSEDYIASSQLIIILSIGCLFKPWGRVFGLTLDAIGKPKVNFQMLAFSLLVNIAMNAWLIPQYGVTGAAIATTSSIILTILLGQIRIKKYVDISPLSEVFNSFKIKTLIATK